MLICINCEIEVDGSLDRCPQCNGPLDEILDEELEDEFEDDDEFEDEEEYEEEEEEEEDDDEGGEGEAGAVVPSGGAAEPAAASGSAAEPSAAAAPAGGAAADEKEEKRRLRKERMARRKAEREEGGKKGRSGRKGRGERPSRRGKAEKDRTPKPPKSIWLPQRRAPVLLATFLTLFVSLYMLSDFVVSILVGQLHAIWVILGPGGLLAALFLWGHGRLGRVGAFVLGITGLAAGVFFLFNWNLENYLFLIAMAAFNLFLLVTLLGKGWFLRTAAGGLLSLLVVAGCLGSLLLDFLPSIAQKRADAALEAVAEAEATLDLGTIQASRAEPQKALGMYADLLQYIDKVPFESMPEMVQDTLYGLMGRKRVTKLYLTPVRLQRKVYQLSPDLLEQPDPMGMEVTFEGRAWVSLPDKGVEEGTVRILRPGRKPDESAADSWEPPFYNATDYEVEYGGLFGETRVRLVEQSKIPRGEPLRIFYQYFNRERDELLNEAWKYILRAKNFMTGGDPSQVGPAVGDMFAEKKSAQRVYLSAYGQLTLDNFLYFDVQYIWIRADEAASRIEEGRKQDDEALVAGGRTLAEEVLTFYDKELFNTLGWMITMLDAEDSPGRTARELLGRDEYPFLYYNYARLHWLLYLLDGRKDEARFEEVRQRVVQMKEIVTAGEPVKFYQMAQRIFGGHDGAGRKLWAARWKKAIKLASDVHNEQERIEIKKGNAPKHEKLVEPEGWETARGQGGEGIYRYRFRDYSVLAKEVTFHIEIRDPANLLDGKGKPVFRNFQLRRGRMPMEVGVVAAGGDGKGRLAFVLEEMFGVDEQNRPVEGQVFSLTEGLEWSGAEQDVLNPEPRYETVEDDWFAQVVAVRLVIEIRRE